MGTTFRAVEATDVEIVRRATEAFNSEGLDALLEFCSPDVEFTEGDTFGADEAGVVVLQGRDIFRTYAQAFLTQIETFQVDLERVLELGEGRVQVIAREYGRTVKGALFDMRIAWVLTLRDRVIVRTNVFWEREAVKAALRVTDESAETEKPPR